jgi:hypothetical protein
VTFVDIIASQEFKALIYKRYDLLVVFVLNRRQIHVLNFFYQRPFPLNLYIHGRKGCIEKTIFLAEYKLEDGPIKEIIINCSQNEALKL